VQRKNTSAAISSVQGKDIENTPYPTFDAMLQGRVAGLNILSVSGEPGASGIVNIRGNSSVANSNGGATANSTSAPLYVIDGVVFDVNDVRTAYGNSNPLAAINPNDIETIDVLKDASAAAIYGARAANGVIIVKT
jgi:TonB-dependent SusC/RagA subfamily outer membrane receptor